MKKAIIAIAGAGLLASAGGLLPQQALAYEKAAFDAKTPADVVKALGAAAPVASSS